MADLFLSYAQEDQACAELLADVLTRRGWTVWWDRRIQVGRSFQEVIEHQLEQARCVVVLWSSSSIQSPWVNAEAAEAARKNRLVPVRIEDVRPPLEFRRLQTAAWLDWRDGPDRPGFVSCLESIEFLVSHTASQPLPDWPPSGPLVKTKAPSRAPALAVSSSPTGSTMNRQSFLEAVFAAAARVHTLCNTKKAATIVVGAVASGLLGFSLGWLVVDILWA